MKNKKENVYVKNTDEEMYEEVTFDVEKSLASRAARLKANKKPTSVALEVDTIEKLKNLAAKRGIPYQVLMRSYIMKGLEDDLAS